MTKKKNETRELVIEYDNLSALWKFELFFKKHLAAGNKIPARVIKLLLKNIRFKEDRLKKEFKARSNQIKSDTLARFADERYQFEFTYKQEVPVFELMDSDGVLHKPDPWITHNCTFPKMISMVINNLQNLYFEKGADLKNLDKDSVIRSIHKNIMSYLSKAAVFPYSKKYAPYAITGYIAWKLGFSLGKNCRNGMNEDEITNEQFKQGARYSLEKKPKNRKSRKSAKKQ